MHYMIIASKIQIKTLLINQNVKAIFYCPGTTRFCWHCHHKAIVFPFEWNRLNIRLRISITHICDASMCKHTVLTHVEPLKKKQNRKMNNHSKAFLDRINLLRGKEQQIKLNKAALELCSGTRSSNLGIYWLQRCVYLRKSIIGP